MSAKKKNRLLARDLPIALAIYFSFKLGELPTIKQLEDKKLLNIRYGSQHIRYEGHNYISIYAVG